MSAITRFAVLCAAAISTLITNAKLESKLPIGNGSVPPEECFQCTRLSTP